MYICGNFRLRINLYNQIYYEQKISGGGGSGGGSSLKGAVIGGVVAGGTGAVIGSRKEIKIEEIKSETIKKDGRRIFINYFSKDERKTLYFKFDDFTSFFLQINRA